MMISSSISKVFKVSLIVASTVVLVFWNIRSVSAQSPMDKSAKALVTFGKEYSRVSRVLNPEVFDVSARTSSEIQFSKDYEEKRFELPLKVSVREKIAERMRNQRFGKDFQRIQVKID